VPVYLLIPRNEGFLGALRAVRADGIESAAATMRQQWPSGDHYEYDFVPLPVGSKYLPGAVYIVDERCNLQGPKTDQEVAEFIGAELTSF